MTSEGRVEATDAVEAEMTADGAPVLLRDKHVGRTAALMMIPGALVFLLAAVAVALGAEPAAPRIAALLPFAVFVAMVYSLLANMVVRTAVTEREVRIHWGMRRMVIPRVASTRCTVQARATGSTLATGAGWSLFADRGSVLWEWKEGDKTRVLLVPAHDPAAVVAAAGVSAGTGVRVAADAERAAETQEASDAERAAEGQREKA